MKRYFKIIDLETGTSELLTFEFHDDKYDKLVDNVALRLAHLVTSRRTVAISEEQADILRKQISEREKL